LDFERKNLHEEKQESTNALAWWWIAWCL